MNDRVNHLQFIQRGNNGGNCIEQPFLGDYLTVRRRVLLDPRASY